LIIDGKIEAEKIIEFVKLNIEKIGESLCLAAILIGNDEPSRIYVRNKFRACQRAGIISKLCRLPEDVTQKKVLELIKDLNNDPEVTGILLQLPLPSHLDKRKIIDYISPEKDVDVFTSVNFAKSALGISDLIPCTPAGIIHLIKVTKTKISGSNCTVVGRSEIVGKPLALALLNENATVTVCHSKTQNLTKHCLSADILVSAVGKPKFILKNMVKPGAVVIDVGMNRMNGSLCGDADFDEVSKIASYITPVPGGVGPMTVAFSMKNTLSLFKKQHQIKSLK
jgi:methylenetetrahydrofolate dehydrogenase (NADP+)/methenyltetrahydrofolate cyclohydrolase